MSEIGPSPGRAVLRCEALVVPKGSAAECEDAHAWNAHRAVVCDGASRAFASGRWAALLARAFLVTAFDAPQGSGLQGSAPQESGPQRCAPQLLDGWLRESRGLWAEQTAQAAEVPVYIRGALARGSAATFVGVDTRDVSSPHAGAGPLLEYRAFAVGDSCLFHLRDGRPTELFPLDRPDQFDTHPDLVPTRAEALESLAPVLRCTEGACGPDDVLLLMTDALAQWALEAAAEHGTTVWTFLEHAPRDEFGVRVQELRSSRAMKEDDVSLVRCRAVATARAVAGAPATVS
ncbi:hypothetical protein SAMN04487981_13643 [Streptomyces sp. cf386]|uniref:hypothetical protein n=1 Tax=Streptomyces sp. cf386 TaxID=1761904 RepID=UPI000880421C|nr:hypothetical protein [Streptomyces sp. cf386]SDP74165.1 hypothetical protein SAMN04487981_13643 [Streptomyces sp. cf386]